MKRILAFLLAAAVLASCAFAAPAESTQSESASDTAVSVPVPSALVMEKTSGKVLYEKNAHEHMPPASVTKIMTLLLTVEEIEAGRLSEDDTVTGSSHASSMGGSQIWLKEGETLTVGEVLKAVAIVSANDCAVALGEHIAGSEEAFVARMNKRAAELGMKDTHFVDCTGLTEDPNHYTSAYDIALMSRKLISYDRIKKYSTIWMDTLRDGKNQLVNTNKLVRFYKGTTGLKTGFTKKAMYCLSATAERDGVEYIAVVLHGATSTERFESAKTLLNWAFANFALCSLRSPDAVPPVRVELGETDSVQPEYSGDEKLLIEKNKLGDVQYEFSLPQSVPAPVEEGQKLGELIVRSDGTELARVPLLASGGVAKLTVLKMYGRALSRLFAG